MEPTKKNEAIATLLETFSQVRNNCPWDRKQTMETLKPMTVEECYELLDAVNNGDYANIREELGDLLMHILFYAEIAEEEGRFDIGDVAKGINGKLIRRHPHIFGSTQAADDREVARNWEQIKLQEKKEKGKTKEGVLSGVPSSLPPMIKAFRIQHKAAGVGFDWTDREQIWEKVNEELDEAHEAAAAGDSASTEAEIGDLLFSVVNLARAYGIDPDNALEKTNRKFIRRFNYVEQALKAQDRPFTAATLEEMDGYWDEAKKQGL